MPQLSLVESVMKYRLCNSYRLEGWKKLPTGLFHVDTGETVFLPLDKYRLLLHMNGRDKFCENDLTEQDKEFIKRLLDRNIIYECSKEEPLLPEQEYHYYNRTYIAYVHWAITGKCNYRCRHCYMYAPKAKFPEPSMEECRKIISGMQDAGVRAVALTGGEPLVRSDFLELADEIISHGIQIHSIYTNGALVTDELLEELEKRGQKPRFHISFDGIEWHDWLRGIPGAKDNAIRTFARCQAHGNEVYAAMCVHRRNRHEMFETVKYLASCGVSRTRIKFMLPNGMWAEQYADESLSMDMAVESLMDFIDAFFKAGMPSSVIVDNLFEYHCGQNLCMIPYARNCRQNGYLCKKAATTPYIGPSGDVLPCMTLGGCEFRNRFPNALETPLSQIMEKSYYHDVTHMKKKEFFDLHSECKNCPERAVCTTGCRACTTKDYLDLDQWNCTFLRGGYYHKIDQAIRKAIQKYGLENEVQYICFTD